MKKYLVAAVICLAFLLHLPYLTVASPLAYETERIFGQDRIETAVKIAQKGWTAATTVILCEFDDYPDSIAAAPFAASLDAPILLTRGDKIDQRVVGELRRLTPQKVVLLGGNSRLTPAIEQELEEMALSWERIGGGNRYETSVLLARRLYSDSLIIANGDNFPDALSAASYAGIRQVPIVLTSKILPPAVEDYILETQPHNLIVIGGEEAVPTESLVKVGLNSFTRLGGQNRYETNAKVVDYMQEVVQSADQFVASGENFPDAVSGTVLAAKFKVPLLLTAKNDIPPAVYSLMRYHMKVEPSPVNVSSGQGIVTTPVGLNLRDTPSAAGKVLLTIPGNTRIDIYGKQGQWYQTAYQGKNGWVSANYVQITQSYRQGKITASGGLNLRQSPSTSAEILQTIPQGATISITGQEQDWYKVTYRGAVGWVFAEYVALLDGSGSAGAGTIDLTPNGKVFILGGTGVISETTENIIRGKANSQYEENLRDFPSLPSSLTGDSSPGTYDPAQEVLLDPFEGIPAGSLTGKKILIDPGHGGPDKGAIGPNYTFEKDNNLAISFYLLDILTEAGATVSMTRNADVSVAADYTERADLQARVTIANNTKPDLFISIHNNANPNPDMSGTMVFYSEQNPRITDSARLASLILAEITEKVDTYDLGTRTADYYVLRHTDMPAVLVEVAFISNVREEGRLQNPIFQKNVAAAIFHGIYGYFN
ncbi:MAG TPA: SH3 domain-containing protein [Peptococcaceae bacterium]|nr:SH3 domain-containing protein [Peptococcaceae bacterium]